MNRKLTVASSAAALVLALLAGCGSLFKGNEEAQAVVSRRAVGMTVGDFFEQFGRPRSRLEQRDGTTLYNWESAVGSVPAGPNSLDDRTCRMSITADAKGKIAAALILLDNPGLRSLSRCSEIFAAG